MVASAPAVANPEDKKYLPACLKSPNCVSTQAISADKRHYVEPFKILGDPHKAWDALKQAIMEQDRMVMTHESRNSLHAEATSWLFTFVDDIEAILDTEAKQIHIRSASRMGHFDFGVNRKRIEALRLQLYEAKVLALQPTADF